MLYIKLFKLYALKGANIALYQIMCMLPCPIAMVVTSFCTLYVMVVVTRYVLRGRRADIATIGSLTKTSVSFQQYKFSIKMSFDCGLIMKLVSCSTARWFSLFLNSGQRYKSFSNVLWICYVQGQFIQLCKTFYDFFADEPNEQELFHAIAAVATLLLQIGEVGKQFRCGEDLPIECSCSSFLDSNWTITFEQLLASMLTEHALVNYFEQQVDLTPAIARFRSRRLLRQTSSSPGAF